MAAVGGRTSPIVAIEKMEGGFCKALLMRKADGSEIVAKLPSKLAGHPNYSTASEVATLKYGNSNAPGRPKEVRMLLICIVQNSRTTYINTGSQSASMGM